MSTTHYKDEGLLLDGVFVTLERSKRDGRLLIEIDTGEAFPIDLFPLGVPKIRIVINDHVMETVASGDVQPAAE